MKMSPWNFQFLDLYHWIHQIQLGFIYFFDIQKQQRSENSASDRLNNLLPPSLVIGSDFAAVTFTAAEMGLKFTRIWANLQQIPSRLSLHLVLSEARGLGVGARGLRGDRRGSQAAAEILIASLGFSLDPITLSGPGRRPVSLGSGYSTHTQKHTLTAHTPRRGLNITRRHVQMETETYSINVRPRTRALIRASVSILASPLMVLTAKQQWGSVLVCSSGSLLAFTPGFCSTVSCGGNKKKNLLGLKW